jgi:succinoglycan biosynthesis protein ExoA
LPDPFVSILIPIRNEAAHIDRCMDAVRSQDYAQNNYEILIADGMSDDGTRNKLKAHQINDSRVKVFDNPVKIVASGLNTLTQHARGEILIRVDGHCVIAPDYISNCVRHIQDKGVDGVGGPMYSSGEDTTSQAIALAMSAKFGVGDSYFRTESGQTKLVDTMPFPAYTRAIIDRVGPYDEELVRNQDDEYNYRIRKAGGKILLAADVRSTYYSRGSLKKLWQQYFQYGFYKVRVLQKHPAQMRLRQFVPFLFLLAIIISAVLSLVFPLGWLTLAGIIGVYLLANIVVSLMLAQKEGWQYLWMLPLAFITLHISYGTGFLVGLFKFWNRWGDQHGQVPGVERA